MRAIAALAPLLFACTATIPEGRLQCADATECPPGWSCAGGLCYSQPRDAGTGPIDAAGDGGRDAGSEPVDGGGGARPGHAGALDAGTPDGGPPEELVGVALGDAHSCAVTSAGRVFCWGANAQGQLGDGSSARRTTAVAIEPGAMPPVSALCAGASHTCALA